MTTETTTTECIAEGHDMGDCCDIDCPDKAQPIAAKPTVLEEIAAARLRQVLEGHTPYLDDKQSLYQLRDKVAEHVMSSWETTGMTEERAHLVSAAALLVAEIERMDRSRLPLYLFRVEEGIERHWTVARDAADVLEIIHDSFALSPAEGLALKITRLPGDEIVTINDDGAKTTKAAAEWAMSDGRGVIASTCE